MLNESEGVYSAFGVEFIANNENTAVNASKEVILAAGAIQTPQLLELSGKSSVL